MHLSFLVQKICQKPDLLLLLSQMQKQELSNLDPLWLNIGDSTGPVIMAKAQNGDRGAYH